VHIISINTDTDTQAVLDLMDWQKPGYLLVPSPVAFIGEVNDVMPSGTKQGLYSLVDSMALEGLSHYTQAGSLVLQLHCNLQIPGIFK
jgi:hypothetical protein